MKNQEPVRITSYIPIRYCFYDGGKLYDPCLGSGLIKCSICNTEFDCSTDHYGHPIVRDYDTVLEHGQLLCGPEAYDDFIKAVDKDL